MKIRTDFVTNSSSSSFIAIKAITKGGNQYIAKLDSGNIDIDVNVHNGKFMVDKEYFEGIKSVSELFKKVYDWFYESLADAACAIDEVEDALRIYGSGDFTEIRSLQKDDVRFAGIFSREEYWDEPWGASLIGYDFESKSLVEEHREESPLCYSEDRDSDDDDSDDCYGENLFDQFRSESFSSVRPDAKSKNT